MTDKEKAEDFFKTYFRIDDDEYEFAKKDSETTISLMVGFAQKENKDLQHRLDVAQGFLDRDTEYQEMKNRNVELKGKYAYAARESATYKQFWEIQKDENKDLKCYYENQIVDLEKQIKVLTQNLEDTEICNKTLEKKVEELEKNNKVYCVGEGETLVVNTTFDSFTRIDANKKMYYPHDVEQVDQLEQAKVIIATLLKNQPPPENVYDIGKFDIDDYRDIIEQAKQFLKENKR